MKSKQPDYENMSVFEQVQQGLKDGIAHARGEMTLKTTTLPAPAPALSKKRVVAIRTKLQMSQGVFASYLNVPKKTLQSWEQGQRKPKAGEARLLQICETAPEQFVTLIGSSPSSSTSRRSRRSSTASRT